MEDAQREILHDHYKETFQYIRERETLRDRLFLVLIGLYALLAVQIQYPRKFDGTVETINLLGIQVDVSSLPLAAFLTATWVFVLAVVVRYCSTALNIERQYDYLHHVEKNMSAEFGDGLYYREGRAYETNYPLFSWAAWKFYTLLLPILGAVATFALAREEYLHLKYDGFTRTLDICVAAALMIAFVLYHLVPSRLQRWVRTQLPVLSAWIWRKLPFTSPKNGPR